VKKSALAPCPACARHVRVHEPACPFCSAALPSSFRQLVAPPPPATRLSRAALYALRVGVLSSAAVACGGSLSTGGSEKDSGQDDTESLPDASYGGPPPAEAGGDDDAQYGVLYGAFAMDANYAVPYGLPAPPPVDAGTEDGPSDASTRPDVVFIAPPYGGFITAYGGFMVSDEAIDIEPAPPSDPNVAPAPPAATKRSPQ
jgi:hypothetical protein